MYQGTAIVDVVVRSGAVAPAGAQTVCVVGKVPGSGASCHGLKLPPVLPGITPRTVEGQVAHRIVGECLTVVAGQQVAPAAVGIAVLHRAQQAAYNRIVYIGILLAAGDVTRTVVGPDTGLTGGFTIFPNQLILGIVEIVGGVDSLSQQSASLFLPILYDH